MRINLIRRIFAVKWDHEKPLSPCPPGVFGPWNSRGCRVLDRQSRSDSGSQGWSHLLPRTALPALGFGGAG